jgi:hypothetical protein
MAFIALHHTQGLLKLHPLNANNGRRPFFKLDFASRIKTFCGAPQAIWKAAKTVGALNPGCPPPIANEYLPAPSFRKEALLNRIEQLGALTPNAA